MSASQHTSHYNLSQFEPNDRPTWLGDYNSDMQKIDSAIAGVRGSTSDIDQKVNTNTDDIAVLKTNVNGLQVAQNQTNSELSKTNVNVAANASELTAQDARLDSLENQVARISDAEDWIIVGDSYGVGNNGFMQFLTPLNPLRTIYDACVSGAGFVGNNSKYIDNLKNVANTIQNKNKIGKIVIVGGTNDIGKTQTLQINATEIVQYAKSVFPFAKIYIGFNYSGNVTNESWTLKKQVCLMEYRKAASTNNVLWMSGLEFCNLNYPEYLGSDGIHMTNSGASNMAISMQQILETGATESLFEDYSINLPVGTNVLFVDGVAKGKLTTNANITQKRYGQNVTTVFYPFYINITADIPINTDATFNIRLPYLSAPHMVNNLFDFKIGSSDYKCVPILNGQDLVFNFTGFNSLETITAGSTLTIFTTKIDVTYC